MKKWIQKNQKLAICIGVFVIFLVLFIIAINKLFFSIEGNSYGKRLEDIKDHPISSEVFKSIKEDVMASDKVLSFTNRLQGKIIYLSLDIKENVTLNEAKELASKAILKFEEDTLNYYDIQIFLTQNTVENSEIFPVIGAKNAKSTSIVW